MTTKLILILLGLSVFSAFAQKAEFGIGLGISHFKGDISPHFNPRQIGIGGHGWYRKFISRSVSVRGQGMLASYNSSDLKTTDPYYNNDRRKYINGRVIEASAVAEYFFVNPEHMVKRRYFSPYLFGGIGYSFTKSKVPNSAQNANSVIIPYGVGIKWRFKGPWALSGEFGTRYTLSDRLDQHYDDFGPSNAQATSQINYGDTSRKDQYYFTSITLSYSLFDIVCPQ